MRRPELPGTATLEAAFVISMGLVIFLVLLYFGLYLHDKAVLMSLAERFGERQITELLEPVDAYGRLSLNARGKTVMLTEETGFTEEEQRFFSDSRSILLITELRDVSFSAGGEGVTVTYSASVRIPGISLFRKIDQDAGTACGTVHRKKREDMKTLVRLMYGLTSGTDFNQTEEETEEHGCTDRREWEQQTHRTRE